MSSESPSDAPAASPPDSRWWYLVLATPLYYVLATGFAFVAALLAFAAAVAGTGEPGPGMPATVGLGVAGMMVGVVLLVLVGLLLTLAFPVAIYLDADAVADAGGDWRPDPTLYGLLGAAGVVAQPLQVPLAVYYLYKRHESVGVP